MFVTRGIYRCPVPSHALAISSNESHPRGGALEYAVDFLLPFDVPVAAAADGVVIHVKDDSNEGGTDEKYIRRWDLYLNIITVQHPNEEFSQYAHIAYNGSFVRKGDVVFEGQLLASGIGMNGLTDAPHLHFHVGMWDFGSSAGFRTLPIQWRDIGPNVLRSREEFYTELKKPQYADLLARPEFAQLRRDVENF